MPLVAIALWFSLPRRDDVRVEPDLIRAQHLHLLEECLNDAVLRRRLGVHEEHPQVGEGFGDPLRGHGGRVGGLRFCLLAVKALHHRLPCDGVTVFDEPVHRPLSIPTDAGEPELVWRVDELILYGVLNLGDERRIGNDVGECPRNDVVASGGGVRLALLARVGSAGSCRPECCRSFPSFEP